MLENLKKWCLALAIIILLTILGVKAYFVYKNYRVNRDTLEIEHGKEEERKKKMEEEEARRKADDALKQLQINKLKGFNPEGKATILLPKNVGHPGFKNHPSITCDVEKSTLIYSDEVNEHFQNILQDIITFKNGEELSEDEEKDTYSNQLKRNNTVLYGAPGTGKTVFVEELVHHLYQEFGKKVEDKVEALKKELEELKEERKKMDEGGQGTAKRTDEQEKERNKKIDELKKERLKKKRN